MPSPSLATFMSAVGLQNPTPASMWNFSPVAGSLSACGLYCARAGAAAQITTATAAARVYKRTESDVSIEQLSPGKSRDGLLGKADLRIAQTRLMADG